MPRASILGQRRARRFTHPAPGVKELMESWRVGLDPELQRAVEVLLAVGRYMQNPLRVSSGFRSRAEQQKLWDARQRGEWPYPVARPGTSRHETGRAVDMVWVRTGTREPWRGAWALVGEVAERFLGLRWGGNFSEPDVVHFELGGFGRG